MIDLDHTDFCSYPKGFGACNCFGVPEFTKETRRHYLNRIYKDEIRQKYTYSEFHHALPNVVLDLMEAYFAYNKIK